MNWKTRQAFNGLKPPVYSSLAMAFAGMGDAFLYPFLPLYSSKVGIPVAWVGVLLSVNRFARIFLSTAVLKVFKKFDHRQVTILASSIAVISTIGYGLNAGLIAWILLRITWGLCFSAMRITTASYALIHHNKGFAVGLSNGIYETGPLLALLVGPLILSLFNIEYTFYLLALVSSLAVFFAYQLPSTLLLPVQNNSKGFREPTSINLLTFSTSFMAEGIVIMVMSVFIQRQYLLTAIEAATIASVLLILRRICSFVASPVGGMLTDRLGLTRMLVVSILCVTAGVILLANNIVLTGLIIIFTFHPITNAVCLIAASADKPNRIAAINRNSLYRDAGAALGTLCGGFIFFSPYLDNILLVAVSFPVFLVISIVKPNKRA